MVPHDLGGDNKVLYNGELIILFKSQVFCLKAEWRNKREQKCLFSNENYLEIINFVMMYTS